MVHSGLTPWQQNGLLPRERRAHQGPGRAGTIVNPTSSQLRSRTNQRPRTVEARWHPGAGRRASGSRSGPSSWRGLKRYKSTRTGRCWWRLLPRAVDVPFASRNPGAGKLPKRYTVQVTDLGLYMTPQAFCDVTDSKANEIKRRLNEGPTAPRSRCWGRVAWPGLAWST